MCITNAKFITVKFSKMTHREILNGEGCFGESYADTFSDCPSNIDTSVLEDDSSFQMVFMLDQQKDKKPE